jgi:YbbR domain-containing protein
MASDNNLFKYLTDRLSQFTWPRILATGQVKDDAVFSNRERVLVFGISYVIAFGLWLMVNLDRDFNLTLDLPLTTGIIADDMALMSPIPQTVSVSINGVGWKVLSMYNNPPAVAVNLGSGSVNLFEQVRDLMLSYPDINVTKVQPSLLNVSLEPRLTKRIPVEAKLDVSFRNQFNFVGPIRLTPDSITITGAESRLLTIDSWPTEVIAREGLRESLDLMVKLENPASVMEINRSEVRLVAQVSEYTEGEVRIPVRTQGLPRGRQVTFSPIAINVRYDVPIDQYVDAQDIVPYVAFVTYSEITSDTTGLVTPTIELTTDRLNLRIRSVQPRTVSYYIVIVEN